VAILEVEVIVGAVEVRRHDCDVVRAVLEVEALTHLEPCDLSDSIGLVGVLQRSSEEGFFAERLLGLSGIDAGAAEEEEVLYAVAEALSDDVLLYLEVVVDEVSAVGIVRHDPPDVRSCEDHRLRALLIEECTYSDRIREIQLTVGTADKVGVATLLEVVPDSGAYEPTMPRDIDLGRRGEFG
jgi:hypothetical protein